MAGDTFHALTTWRVLARVGDGGMAEVFLAEQLGLGRFVRHVGVKTIRRELAARSGYRALFMEEATRLAGLRHENIQLALELVTWDDRPALIFEWVHGLTLEDLNARLDERDDYLPPNLALHIVSRVARALAHIAHHPLPDGRDGSLVHCDVSPVNILVGWDGVVKLTDFGIAREGHRDGADRNVAGLLGKAPYLSPEQAAGLPLDPRSDIFSLGLVLFELLTGAQAFPARDLDETLALHARWDVPSPCNWNPAIPPAVEDILRGMIARRPEDRFPSAAAVVSAIQDHVGRHGVGPSGDALARYLDVVFPEVDKRRVDPSAFRPFNA
jgi:serine/threonine protein kinase